MAKANADKAPDPETRKLLWLKIARREVERCRSADIEDAMRVLQASAYACRCRGCCVGVTIFDEMFGNASLA